MLEFKKLDVSVGKRPILKDISLQFEKGKITSVVGPNGCGKTTLLQTLNGLSSVTAGQILLDGKDYLKLSLKERACLLSFMPQFRDTPCGISVQSLVEHGRFPYMGFSRKMDGSDKKAVERALELTKLTEYADCLVNELSGGLRQRTYIAMQLAQDSQYIVLDEPTSFLDFSVQREIYSLINELKMQGKTIILVLHDLSKALQISDNMVIMKNLKIIKQGVPGKDLENRLIEEVFDCSIQEIKVDGKKEFIIT